MDCFSFVWFCCFFRATNSAWRVNTVCYDKNKKKPAPKTVKWPHNTRFHFSRALSTTFSVLCAFLQHLELLAGFFSFYLSFFHSFYEYRTIDACQQPTDRYLIGEYTLYNVQCTHIHNKSMKTLTRNRDHDFTTKQMMITLIWPHHSTHYTLHTCITMPLIKMNRTSIEFPEGFANQWNWWTTLDKYNWIMWR